MTVPSSCRVENGWTCPNPVTTIFKNLSAPNPNHINDIRRPSQLTTACAPPLARYAQSEMSTAAQTQTKPLSNASFTLLPTEDVVGFNAALDCYLERFDPQDHHEVFLTQLMVQSTWKLARIHRIQAALFKHVLEPDVPPVTLEAAMAAAMFKANPNAFQTLERLAAAAERSYFKALRELERGRKNPPQPVLPNEANFFPRPAAQTPGRPPHFPAHPLAGDPPAPSGSHQDQTVRSTAPRNAP